MTRCRSFGLPLPVRTGALLAALLLLLPSYPAPRAEPPAKLRPLVKAGEKAATFTLSDLDGKKRTFRADGGEPAILVFWSAFCPLCRELARPLEEVSRRPGGRGVRLVWVNLDGKRFTNAVRSFAAEIPIESPVLLDEIRGDLFVACDPYGVEKTPTVITVGGDGRVRCAYVAEEIRALVKDFDRIAASLRGGKDPCKPAKSR